MTKQNSDTNLHHYKKKGLLFAPMEGYTNAIYRESLQLHKHPWDHFFTDFLRLPTQGTLTSRQVIEHIGKKTLEQNELIHKTTLQILCRTDSDIRSSLKTIKKFHLPFLDLNLGCPSKKVCAHKGGAYFLKELDFLSEKIQTIREFFDGHLSAKIRLGFNDSNDLESIIERLNNAGVNTIIVHGRIREQFYSGYADWDAIKRCSEVSVVPIIANGDITLQNYNEALTKTQGYAAMIGRDALANPVQQKDLASFFEHNFHAYKSQETAMRRTKGLIAYWKVFKGHESIRNEILRITDSNQFIKKVLTHLGKYC